MKSYTLRINNRHLKDEIEGNYFYWLDVFHRALSVALLEHCGAQGDIDSVTLESTYYNSILGALHKRTQEGHNPLEELYNPEFIGVYMDMSLYLKEFIEQKHINSVTNIYHLTIDHGYNVVVNLKQLGKRLKFDSADKPNTLDVIHF